ncbi:MAG: thioesterase family protein [Acidimicrobiia bacterium]|nr:thioesterase family protein [Acidimicrobiia bacterium]MDH4307928.1 thioesterase family protein [Acidimicrobiia bacterium]MDH5294725.1 thioesterase family protein [Acidimicrobiia bacterium]
MSFSVASAVQRSNGTWTADLSPDWAVMGNANGGYLMAIAARAMAAESGRQPVTLTAHFLSPGTAGPVTVSVDTIKTGRAFTTMRAELASGDRLVAILTGSFGDLRSLAGPVRVDAQPPALPPPEDCVRVEPAAAGLPPPLTAHVDLRLHPEDASFGEGRPSGRPLFRGWLRPLPADELDEFMLLLAVDVFPPTVFNAAMPVAWTPTLELTAHLRAVPSGGWLRCQFSTRFITGGLLEEDGELWDDEGRLVAQSRQLALIPRG